MMKYCLALLLMTITKVSADPCSDGTISSGSIYGSGDECNSYYFYCLTGIGQQMNCAAGTVWNDDVGYCDHPYNVAACSADNVVDCKDSAGRPATTGGYTKPSDCKNGFYYVCENGVEVTKTCPSGLAYDPVIQNCDWVTNLQDCDVIQEPDGSANTTTTTTTTKSPVVTDPAGTGSNSSTTVSTESPAGPDDPSINSTNPGSETGSGVTHDPPFTGDSTITTTTTATETEPQGDTYVGFVVDDTGSMSVEIEGVKKWIISCVDGSSTSCGNPPTGGWVTTSFNDPSTGIAVGPTLDINIIIDEVDRYYAHGGGDCPELGFAGLKNAVNVIPKVNSGCKIYFFTDATAKDSDQVDAVTKLYQDKGCSFIPLLTGCCGPCPAVCDTVDPDYYNTHVTDHTGADSTCSTRIARSVSANIQTLFYTLSEETGGNIYVTDKPRSSDEMLEFLEEEVTLGFCGTSVIAGPSPDGYKCEKDCSTMKMCWDRGVSKCYCNDTSSCRHDPVSSGYSRCEGEQVVECKSNEALQIIPDQNNCTRYFQCNSGNLHHFSCAPGTVFSVASTSYCDHPYNVPLPCGTYVPEEDDIM